MSLDLINKNTKLINKLLDYLAKHPLKTKDKVTYVAFSKDDEELNKINFDLLNELKAEGKTIIKANETSSKSQPWEFQYL